MSLDPILERLARAFDKQRSELLATDEGRWALLVQPHDKRRRPQLVGCFDDSDQACSAGYASTVGSRFMIQEILEQDRVVSVPSVVLANRL